MFSCEYCEIFQNSFFYKNTSSGLFWNWDILLLCDTYNFKIYEDSMSET